MAKIAAIILPSSHAGRLPDLLSRMRRVLCLNASHYAETDTYVGEHAACVLLRVAPDPLNTARQPINEKHRAGVACGYYLSREETPGGSATRLIEDLAIGGVDVLPGADGVYAFACWDAQRECLVTGVDKLGMRPLFWAQLPGGGYAVASEIKALAVLMVDLEINWAAWEEHLTFGFIFGDHSFFNGIRRFGVAESITFFHDRHDSRIVEGFLETIEIIERPTPAFLEEQSAVFDKAMQRLASLYDAGRDTIITLSGGFDSRRILGWLLNQDIRPTAYTVPEVHEDGREFESAIVRELCRVMELSGYYVYPETVADRIQVRLTRDLSTDFESDEHNFSTILAMGLSCHDKVNFDGLAAGSQLSGSFVSRSHFEPGGQDRFLASLPRSARGWLNFPKADAPPLKDRVYAELQRWGDHPNRFAYFYLLSRTRREIALAPLSIQANVFESLCPFLERSMMRSALSFPPIHKIGANIQASAIAALNPVLGRLPTVYSPGVPDDPKYRIFKRQVEQGARRDVLKRASRLRNRSGSYSGKQKLRFRAANVLAGLGVNRRIAWEIGKAAKAEQLAHFERVVRSPECYSSAARALAVAVGQRPEWCKSL